jgi:hypothetical protein
MAIPVFAVTTLEALEFALLCMSVDGRPALKIMSSHLLLLTALVVGMCLANQVKIFLVEKGVFGLALLSSTLPSLAMTLTAALVILFVFVYDESFANLPLLLVKCVS